MNYIVFGLGVLLAAAGCVSIYGGYDIIQVERGWTEVIAGATAVSGGIVTIALGMILRRLDGLSALYQASMRPLPAPNSLAFEPAEALSVADLTPPPLVARLPNAGPARDVPGRGRSPVPPAARPPEPAYVPEPEPAEASAPAANATFEHIARAAFTDMELRAPDLFASQPAPAEPKPQPAAAALSLDEMWKRVSEEIDSPILPPEPEAAAEEHPLHSQAEAPSTVAPDANAVQPPPLPEPAAENPAEAVAPRDIEDIWPLAESPAAEPLSVAPAPAPQPEPQHTPYMPPPVEPPVAEPAVIGRYEAEGTAYLMFDDGSIEAQSEAGIFRFASMAELKAFIEDKQAAEV